MFCLRNNQRARSEMSVPVCCLLAAVLVLVLGAVLVVVLVLVLILVLVVVLILVLVLVIHDLILRKFVLAALPQVYLAHISKLYPSL